MTSSINKKINVIFVDSKGISNAYGIGSYRANLIPEIAASDDINLFCVTLSYSDVGVIKVKKKNRCTYIEITLSNKTSQNYSRNREQISTLGSKIFFHLIKKASKCQDGIIHLNSTGELELCKIAKQNGYKIILTQHVQLFRTIMEKKADSGYWMSSIIRNDKEFLRLVDGVICLSQNNLDMAVQEYDVPAMNARLVYNGILSNDLKGKKIELLRKRLGFLKKDFIILYVGRIADGKGIYELIDAFAAFSRKKKFVKLLIAGDGDIRKAISKAYSTLANITFTGFLSGKQLETVFRIADIGVLPSHSEQASYSVLEMMNYQLPVIVSDIYGFALFKDRHEVLKVEITEHNEENLQKSISHASLVSNIETLYTNYSLRKLLVENANKLLDCKLNSKYMASQTIELYKAVYN